MIRQDLRLFLPALVAWAVAAFILSIAEHAFLIAAVTGALVTIVWAFALLFHKRMSGQFKVKRFFAILTVSATITLTLIAALSFRIGTEHVHRSGLEPQVASAAENVRWNAIITSTPTDSQSVLSSSSSVRANATLIAVFQGEKRYPTSVPVRLMGNAESFTGVKIGSTVAFSGEAQPLPNTFSSAYMIQVRDLSSKEPTALLGWTHELRQTLRFAANQLDGWGAQLIPGLAVGDTGLVEEQLDSAMKASALSHLTAVSGANCAIITGLILLAGKALRIRRTIRVAAAIIFLGLFVLLVTPEPSVVRAAVMSVLAMISMLSARKGVGSAALAVAIIILLAIDPWQAQHFGFVLSVLATAGIILFTNPIAARLQRFIPHWLALMLAVPIAAQIACQPAIIFLQPTLPTFGVVANVLAAPAAPVATILGLIACVSLPVWPWFGEFATWLTWFPAWWISSIAGVSSSLPGAQLPWVEGWVGVLVLGVISAILLNAFLANRLRSSTSVLAVTLRSMAVWVSISILLSIAVVRPVAVVASIPSHWRIFACDVGQGDAVLVRGSAGIMLIDTGIEPQRVRSCLNTLGIREIDVLVLTHDDKDHVGGLSAVAHLSHLAIIAPMPQSSELSGVREVVSELDESNVQTHIARHRMRGSLGDLQWQVLWPDGPDSNASPNDSSVIIRIDAPELSAIFLGDLSEEAQKKMLRTRNVRPVDVVKVSHHGSADQSHELYEKLSATYGVVSVGEENRYGHPTSSLLATLEKTNTVALRTDLQGSVAIARDRDGTWQVWQSAAVG